MSLKYIVIFSSNFRPIRTIFVNAFVQSINFSFVVLLGKGEHQIASISVNPTTLGITRSNITFIGTGKDTTTILGGFGIYEQENITFKNMTTYFIFRSSFKNL